MVEDACSYYYIEILRILEHADNQKAFYYDKRPSFVEQLRDAQSLNPKLIERDCVNNAWVRSPEFGADGFTTLNDRVYASRDRGRSEPGKDDCFAMSRVIHSGQALLAGDPGTGLHNRLWQFFRDRATVYGPNHEQPLSSLSFDSVWLQDLSSTFAEQWCWMHKTLSCRRSDLNRFHLMSWLSAIAFAAKARRETVKDLGILQVLLALAVGPNMADILPPPIDRFELASGYTADVSVIRAKVRISCISSQSRRGKIARELPQEPHESSGTYKWRCEQYFEQCQGRAVNSLTKLIHGQWPCEHPDLDMSILPKAITSYIDVPFALSEVSRQFQTWYNNHLFYKYLGKIAQVTEKLKIAPSLRLPNPDPAPTDPASSRLYLARDGFTSVAQLFAQNQPLLHFTQARPALQIHQSARASKNPFSARKHSLKVHGLTERLKLQASSDFQKRYAADLRESTESLEMMSNEQMDLPQDLEELKLKLEEYRDTCARYSGYLLSIIKKSIGAHDLMGRVTRPMPRITPRLFISQLAAHRWELLPDAWKRMIVCYGLSLHDHQRAERLLALASPERQNELVSEVGNPGHTSWDPLEHPMALLMEIEGKITIRPIQMRIAAEMISPPGRQNSIMQLNMGEGKSSVIVPLVAASLAASREKLIRVVVAKPQSKQMFEMLVAKLGGLQSITIRQLPFSRDLRLDATDAVTIAQNLKQCAAEGEILLVQPEHLLSFKLMGQECLINSKTALGKVLLQTQNFFESCSRDIVDESDENFSVKFELIYTMGEQRPVAFSPGRWLLVHQILDIVRQVCPSVARTMPKSINHFDRYGPGSFPFVRVLGNDGQHSLVCAIAQRICATGLASLPVARQDEASRAAVYTYITEQDLSAAQIAQVEAAGCYALWNDTSKNTLLLLRGILAGGILGFVLGQKRWRVNYGLDPDRRPPTGLAVPYRAKDSPSPRSEFSHPEVILLLTSLSYY